MKTTMIRALVIVFSLSVLGTMAVSPRLSAATRNSNNNANQNSTEEGGCCGGMMGGAGAGAGQ